MLKSATKGSRTTTLVISNEEVKNTFKTIKSLKDSGIKGLKYFFNTIIKDEGRKMIDG